MEPTRPTEGFLFSCFLGCSPSPLWKFLLNLKVIEALLPIELSSDCWGLGEGGGGRIEEQGVELVWTLFFSGILHWTCHLHLLI